MKNYDLHQGKLTRNLVLFQRVQDLIDRSNFNFKALKLILNHRKKCISFDDFAGWIVPECLLTCNAVDFFFSLFFILVQLLSTFFKSCFTEPYFMFACCHIPCSCYWAVPAESCNEIKRSEKGRNGKYWLSSIIPGTLILSYCDMSSGG